MTEASSFGGKVAFVTGGGTGIGRATALAFARKGAQVAVVGLTSEPVEETVRAIENNGGDALAFAGDVTRAGDVEAAIRAAVERFGRLDSALTNAGIEQPVIPLTDIEDEEFDRQIAVNLRGLFLCVKHEVPEMMKQGAALS